MENSIVKFSETSEPPQVARASPMSQTFQSPITLQSPGFMSRAYQSIKGAFEQDNTEKPLAKALQATPLAAASATILGMSRGRLLTVVLIVLLSGFVFLKLQYLE